jgi:hypothetical protein
MFQLNAEEVESLRFQSGSSNGGHGGRRYLPFAFTEQGVAMLSSVLNSERAVQVNIAIMRAFVQLRDFLGTNQDLARKFDALEKQVGQHGGQIKEILDAIREMLTPRKLSPRREIGFHVKDEYARGEAPQRQRRFRATR